MNLTGGVPGREGVKEKKGGDGRQAVSACIFPVGPGQEGSVEEEDWSCHIGRGGAQGCCQEAGAQTHHPLGREKDTQ